MANASKRYPYVVEIYVEPVDNWFSMGAFKTFDEAEHHLAFVNKRVEEPLRVRDFRSGDVLVEMEIKQ